MIRRYLFSALLISLGLLSQVRSSDAQWIEAGVKQSDALMGNGAFLIHEGSMYLWNGEKHMLKSTDNGVTWIDLSDEGLPLGGANPHITQLTAAGNRIYGGLNFGTGNGVPVYSEDAGATWKLDTLGAPPHQLGWGGLPAVRSIYAWGRTKQYVFITWDGPNLMDIKEYGGTWTHNTHLSEGIHQPKMFFSSGDSLIAITGLGVEITTDGGTTWTAPANKGYFPGGVGWKDENRIYVWGLEFVLNSNGIPIDSRLNLIYTDDLGENWTWIHTDTLSQRKDLAGSKWGPAAFFAHKNTMFYAAPMGHFGSRPNVFKSTDTGATWSPDSTGFYSSYVNGVQQFGYTPDGYAWAVPSYWELYKQKVDAGIVVVEPVTIAPALIQPQVSWTVPGTEVTFRWASVPHAVKYHLQVSTDAQFATIVIDDAALTDTVRTATLLAGTTYYWRVNGVASDESAGPLSEVRSFETEQAKSVGRNTNEMQFSVYPNPASGMVTIKSAMPIASVVVLDVLGKSVRVVDQQSSSTSVDLKGLPSGVYTLQATDAYGRTSRVKLMVK